MSWWVYLEDRTAKPVCSYGVSPEDFVPDYAGDEPCSRPCYPSVEVESHSEGGTYALGGTDCAELNVTYNYGGLFSETLGLAEDNWLHFDLGFKDWLTGKTGEEAAPLLEAAVEKLTAERDSDYWAATPGNAGYTLSILARWARQHPAAIFRVS